MSDFRTAPEFASARRHWVTSKVFEAEGFEDEVVISMVCRRIAEPQLDRHTLASHVRILMEERADAFLAALWEFLGEIPTGDSPPPPPPPDAAAPPGSLAAFASGEPLSDESYSSREYGSVDGGDERDSGGGDDGGEFDGGDDDAGGAADDEVVARLAAMGSRVQEDLYPEAVRRRAPPPPQPPPAAAPTYAAEEAALHEQYEASRRHATAAPPPPSHAPTPSACGAASRRLGCGGPISTCAVCAMHDEGFDQLAADQLTPLTDPPLTADERESLVDWLAESARQLYGKSWSNSWGDALVQRAAAILANSQLSAVVFRHCRTAEEAAEEAAAAAATGGVRRPPRLDVSALPSSQRALLDESTLAFCAELWRVLRRDDPQTADSLLRGDDAADAAADAADDAAAASSSSAAAGARCVARQDLDAERRARLSGGWDMVAVRRWVERRVVVAQGFTDHVVIDAVCRRLDGAAKHAYGDGGGELGDGVESSNRLDKPTMTSYLTLFMDDGAAAFVDDLFGFLASAAAHPTTNGNGAPPPPPPLSAAANGNGKAAHEEEEDDDVELAKRLPSGVKEWCEPEAGAPEVLLLAPLSEGVLVVVRHASGRGALLLQLTGARRLVTLPTKHSLTPLRRAWAAPDAALLHVGDGGDGSGERLLLADPSGAISPLLVLPPHLVSIDATYTAHAGLVLAALVSRDAPPPRAPRAPLRWPPRSGELSLERYTHNLGWQRVASVAAGSDGVAISADGLRAGWCVRRAFTSDAELGEFFVCEMGGAGLHSAHTPRAITEGAGRCGTLAIAPDGSGVAYVADHERAPLEAGGALALWYVPWAGGVPPLQLSPPQAPVLRFGWAPTDEAEEKPPVKTTGRRRHRDDYDSEEASGEEEEGEGDDAEPESAVRLWLTTARELHAHTLLLDTWGTILSQFELPVAAAAVAWLDDGRRVLVTEGAARLPALWDGAGFSPLPLPPGCAQVECTPLAWSSDSDAAAAADDGTARLVAPEPVCRGVLFTLKGRTAPDAPLIVHVGAPSAPLLALRAATDDGGRCPTHALLRCGYRVLRVGRRPAARR